MIKDINDYVKDIQKQYPMLSEKAIKNIMTFGFHMYYWITMRGCDILIKDDVEHKITAMTGWMRYDALQHYIYGERKWRLKENLLAKLKKIPWDGYYYFGLSKSRADDFNNDLKNNRKKIIELNNIIFYRNSKVLSHSNKLEHIYKIKYPSEVGDSFYKSNYKYPKKYIFYLGKNTENIWKKAQIPLREV